MTYVNKPFVKLNLPWHNTLYGKDQYHLYIDKLYFNHPQNYYSLDKYIIDTRPHRDRMLDKQVKELLAPLYDTLQPHMHVSNNATCEAVYFNTLHGSPIRVPVSCQQTLMRTYLLCTKEATKLFGHADQKVLHGMVIHKETIKYGTHTCIYPWLAIGSNCLILLPVKPSETQNIDIDTLAIKNARGSMAPV